MLLSNFAMIMNLHPVIAHDIKGDHQSLARALAWCTLLLLGADTLTPAIIQWVQGANKIVPCNLGKPRGDLALIRHRLISLSAVVINAFHLWITTDYDSACIITPDALHFNPPGLRAILALIAKLSTATYVCEPLASGQDRINVLLNSIRNATDFTSLTFEDKAVTWYFDLLLCGRYANDSTGIDNGIFAAYWVQIPSTQSISFLFIYFIFLCNRLQTAEHTMASAMYTAGNWQKTASPMNTESKDTKSLSNALILVVANDILNLNLNLNVWSH